VKVNGFYIKDIIPNITVTGTAIDLYATYPQLRSQPCAIEVLSGNIYFNPKAVATTLNGNKIEGKTSLEVVVSKGASIISDATATVQIWILG